MSAGRDDDSFIREALPGFLGEPDERVCAFTHHVETLLDLLREGRVHLTPAPSTVLLRSSDQIRAIVAECAAAVVPSPEDEALGDGLEPRPREAAATGARWHVAVGFGPETFRNGMDPLAILDDVHRDGVMTALRCDIDRIPRLEAIDPESCFLAFEFDLLTPKSRRDIEAAFESSSTQRDFHE